MTADARRPELEPKPKPEQHTVFAFSAPRPGFAGFPAPAAAEPPSSDPEDALRPSAPDPPRHSQVGRPALGAPALGGAASV